MEENRKKECRKGQLLTTRDNSRRVEQGAHRDFDTELFSLPLTLVNLSAVRTDCPSRGGGCVAEA
jgi:hypothetical protein